MAAGTEPAVMGMIMNEGGSGTSSYVHPAATETGPCLASLPLLVYEYEDALLLMIQRRADSTATATTTTKMVICSLSEI
jgi:hypothetical protein